MSKGFWVVGDVQIQSLYDIRHLYNPLLLEISTHTPNWNHRGEMQIMSR